MIDSAQFSQHGGLPGPPAPFRQTAPGVLKLARGGGPIAILGTPFFLAGVLMLLSAASIVPMRSESGSPSAILAPMGLVFLTVGGVMVFGRQWLVLDLGKRSILKQIGLGVPLRTEERALGEFHAIVISHHLGDSESAETYPVMLRASIGKDVAMVKPLRFAESLATAEYLARALSLQLVDATTDRETTISPERTGESMRDRLSRGFPETPPRRPPSMRSDIKESAGEIRIVMPGGGPTLAAYAGFVVPIAVFSLAMVFAIPSLLRSTHPLRLFCILLLLFGVPTAYANVQFMISRKHQAITVTASRTALVIERLAKGGVLLTEIPAADVFDVDCSTIESAVLSDRHSADPAKPQISGHERVFRTLKKLVPNPGIVIKSRTGLITIGEGLPANELEYMAWIIRKTLIA